MRLRHGISMFLLFCPIAANAAEKPNVSAPPISNRLLEGEIELVDGETISFKALEGSLVTIQSPSTGPIALSGEILDENSRQVRFVVFRVETYGPRLQGLTQIDTIEVRDGLASSLRSLALEGLKVKGIHRSDRVSEADVKAYRERLLGPAIGGKATDGAPPISSAGVEEVDNTCCVTCGSVTACGCSVSMSCGSCCAGPCCSGNGVPIRQTRD